jgi:hypothetical protein
MVNSLTRTTSKLTRRSFNFWRNTTWSRSNSYDESSAATVYARRSHRRTKRRH